jgi:WD40 repeat protein
LLRRFKANGTTAGLSRDGKTIAYQDGRIKLVDLATGKEIGQLAGHSDMVITGLAFSEDNKSLISAGEDMTIRVWNIARAKEIYRISGAGNRGLVLSPDGKVLAAIAGCTIRMWEVDTGKELLAFDGHRDKVQTIAMSPDGKTLASVGISDKTVHLWDTASSKEIRRCTGHEDWVVSLTFSPNGKILASGGGTRDPTICLWEVTTGTILRQLPANSGGFAPVSMAFSPDGKLLASAGRGFAIHLWEVETGKKIAQISNNQEVIAFSPAGKFLASAAPLRLWDISTGFQVRRMENSPPRASTLAFSPDGKTLAWGNRSGDGRGSKSYDQTKAPMPLSWFGIPASRVRDYQEKT